MQIGISGSIIPNLCLDVIIYYVDYKKLKNEGQCGQAPIAFRADFDAVVCQDGCARHLCGHDGHSAILAGLAVRY